MSSASLLHIPSENNKHSKKEGPLEKETRRFNRLVKEIESLQIENDRQKEDDDNFQRLFFEKVHPLLVDVAAAQVAFISKLEKIFYEEKFAKNIERRFVEFAIPVLTDAAHYSETAKTMLENYIVWQTSISPKTSQQPVIQENEREDENDWNGKNNTGELQEETTVPDLDKKSVTELYKELAKQIHPDLERDEKLRFEKEQLMKELTEARGKEDLYAMLLIRQKAAALNDSADDQSPYTLQLLKKYNNSLKKKLAQLKREIDKSIFESFHSKEAFFANGKQKQSVDIRIKKQVKDMKELHENLQHNTRIINNGAQLKELLD